MVADSGSWRNISSDHLHNFLSRDGVTPTELRTAALAQLGRYPCIKIVPGSVATVDGDPGNFLVTLSDGRATHTRRVILASGVEDLLPDIPGLPERWGQSVVHCPYCHGWERAGLTLGVLAVSERAVHEAVHVQRFSDDTTLYTNRNLHITADQRQLLSARDIKIHEGRLTRLEGTDTTLSLLVFSDGSTAACQTLFCRAPTRQRSDLAMKLGCRMFDDGAVEVDHFGQTTRPGIYAVGDMARTASNTVARHHIATSAAAGHLAALVIDQDLLYND
jgi:thioredoxin reductase